MTTLELAERCENASGPDAELDWLVIDAINPDARWAYTSSVDAALTLVPTGWRVRDLCDWSGVDEDGGWSVNLLHPDNNSRRCAQGEALTPALAICAAALRARHGEL